LKQIDELSLRLVGFPPLPSSWIVEAIAGGFKVVDVNKQTIASFGPAMLEPPTR